MYRVRGQAQQAQQLGPDLEPFHHGFFSLRGGMGVSLGLLQELLLLRQSVEILRNRLRRAQQLGPGGRFTKLVISDK